MTDPFEKDSVEPGAMSMTAEIARQMHVGPWTLMEILALIRYVAPKEHYITLDGARRDLPSPVRHELRQRGFSVEQRAEHFIFISWE